MAAKLPTKIPNPLPMGVRLPRHSGRFRPNRWQKARLIAESHAATHPEELSRPPVVVDTYMPLLMEEMPDFRFDAELASGVLRRIMAGESVSKACAALHTHSERFMFWVIKDIAGMAGLYYTALQIRAYGWAEEIIEIGDEKPADITEFHWNRLRCENRKWLSSRLLQALYGDRSQVEFSGNVDLGLVLNRLDEQEKIAGAPKD